MSRNAAKTITLTAASAIAAGLFVTFGGAVAGLNGLVRGVSVTPADAAGDDISVDTLGDTEVICGGTVAALDLLSSNAAGKAVAGGTKPAARALEAGVAGQKIRAVLLPNNT
jgi:hypothetical protein